MIRLFCLLAIVGLTSVASPAFAQPATGLTDGAAFANGVVPTNSGQIVNPSGVDSSAWTSTSSPTTVPSNLGSFSKPATGNSTYMSAKSLGLTGLGTKSQTDCANYVQGTDPEKDQQCAAVNFMSNNCIPLNAAQSKVTGNTSIASGGANNCNGTYGQGVAQFGFHEMTSSDGIFNIVDAAQTGASSAQAGNCTPQNVVVTPAQNSTNTCQKSLPTTQHNCAQTLSCVVVHLCPSGGSLSGGTTCTTISSQPAGYYYYCPGGWTLSGTSCLYSYTATFTAEYFGGVISVWTASTWGYFVTVVDESGNGSNTSYAAQLSCPSGGTLSAPNPLPAYSIGSWTGAIYSGYTGAMVATIDPVSATCTNSQAASLAYNCPSGGVLSGASCVFTTTYGATSNATCSWGDSCTPFEISAGATLPLP